MEIETSLPWPVSSSLLGTPPALTHANPASAQGKGDAVILSAEAEVGSLPSDAHAPSTALYLPPGAVI